MLDELAERLIGEEQNRYNSFLMGVSSKTPLEQRVLSITGIVCSLCFLSITIAEQIKSHRALREAAALGAIIDVSPDQFQLNFRIALALGLGALCLWSSRARKIALVIAATFLGFGLLLFSQNDVFDRTEPLIHIAALSVIVSALVLIRREWSDLLDAFLAGTFVLINYLDWFLWTRRIKQYGEVASLYPYTKLNNLLYGAEIWHVVVLLVTIGLLAWELRLLIKRCRLREDG
jgi:hypothetical protein